MMQCGDTAGSHEQGMSYQIPVSRGFVAGTKRTGKSAGSRRQRLPRGQGLPRGQSLPRRQSCKPFGKFRVDKSRGQNESATLLMKPLPLSKYELKRLETIAANERKLVEMGLTRLVSKKKQKAKKQREPNERQQPKRASTRLCRSTTTPLYQLPPTYNDTATVEELEAKKGRRWVLPELPDVESLVKATKQLTSLPFTPSDTCDDGNRTNPDYFHFGFLPEEVQQNPWNDDAFITYLEELFHGNNFAVFFLDAVKIVVNNLRERNEMNLIQYLNEMQNDTSYEEAGQFDIRQSKISAYFQHYYYEKYGKNDDYEDHEWLKDALNYDTLTDIDKMICKFIMHIHIQQIQPPYRLSNEKERYKINTMKDTRMHRRNPYVTCPKCKRGFKLKNDKTFKKHDDNNSRSCTITDTTVTDTITELTGTENTLDDVIKLFHTKR
jgi:hypothetical protein